MERTATRGGLTSCIKKADIYATSITPTYNGLKTYPTAYGGLLSIFSFVVILGWLTIQSVNIWFSKKGALSSYSKPNLDSDGNQNPLWNITFDDMIITN